MKTNLLLMIHDCSICLHIVLKTEKEQLLRNQFPIQRELLNDSPFFSDASSWKKGEYSARSVTLYELEDFGTVFHSASKLLENLRKRRKGTGKRLPILHPPLPSYLVSPQTLGKANAEEWNGSKVHTSERVEKKEHGEPHLRHNGLL